MRKGSLRRVGRLLGVLSMPLASSSMPCCIIVHEAGWSFEKVYISFVRLGPWMLNPG